jgi:nitroreductase
VLFEASGWKWLNKYQVDFLKKVPAIVAVVGNPKGTGADMFLPDGNVAYQHACAAAIQNMMLAAHSFGLGSLWFTLFDRKAVREILGVSEEKDPLALICLGKPDADPLQVPRKSVEKKVSFMK